MNFREFEKKAKCLYCERPINIRSINQVLVNMLVKGKRKKVKQKDYFHRCECSLSKRFKNVDGYDIFMPVSHHYDIFIDTGKPLLRVNLSICLNPQAPANQQMNEYKKVLETDELPEFIFLPRLKLIDHLDKFMAFL